VSKQSLKLHVHERIFIAEATIQKQICCDITPTSGSSAGYRKKQSQSHDRFTYGPKAYYPKIHTE